MDHENQSQAISAWAKKDNIEKALTAAMHGAAELKHDEKIHYLGEFKENILRILSPEQVAEAAIYPEIVRALKDKRASKMIIDGSISIRFIEKYKRLARKMNKPYILRSDPKFKELVGLIVVSDEAADLQDITAKDRNLRLTELGISSALIHSAGKKVCKECLEQILEADPDEVSNYSELTFLDRIGGERCPAH